MIKDHSVNLVTSQDLVCILQTDLYFTYRHLTDWSIFKIYLLKLLDFITLEIFINRFLYALFRNSLYGNFTLRMLVTQRNISVKLYYVVSSFVILFTQATMSIPLRLGYQSDIWFLGSISDVDIDNGANICKVTIPRSYISRNELFERFWTLQTHKLQTRWLISNFFADLASPYGAWHLVKISWSYSQ